nr:MAG TPA: hypothetical protein [Caudoviricetes sp.]
MQIKEINVSRPVCFNIGQQYSNEVLVIHFKGLPDLPNKYIYVEKDNYEKEVPLVGDLYVVSRPLTTYSGEVKAQIIARDPGSAPIALTPNFKMMITPSNYSGIGEDENYPDDPNIKNYYVKIDGKIQSMDELIALVQAKLDNGEFVGAQGPKGEPGDVTEEYRNLASQIAQNASDAQASATNAQVSATSAQKALDDTKIFANQTKTELNQIKTDTNTLKEEANTSAVNAQASATSAQESATNAQESATNASQSATSAQTSATNAQKILEDTKTFANQTISEVNQIKTDTSALKNEANASATSAQKALDDTKDFVNQAKTELNQIKTDTSVLKDEANTSAVNAKASETKAKEYADNLQASTDDISQLKEDLGNKAPAIIEKESGKTIVINDSSNLPMRILTGTGKIIITGKNILDDTKYGNNYFTPFEAKAGTLFTLITNGELSAGGNVKFIGENDEEVWFAIDTGKTKVSQKIQANVKGFVDLLTQKEGLKYCFSVGENDEYEEYVEQVITAPVDSEQLKAIHTNYPTTVLTSENEISVEYVADTEAYIEKRIKEENQSLQKQILEIQNALISQKISDV